MCGAISLWLAGFWGPWLSGLSFVVLVVLVSGITGAGVTVLVRSIKYGPHHAPESPR